MENLEISLPLVNGNSFDLKYESGKELIHEMVADDWGPPPRMMVIEAAADDGRRVVISIPYSDSATAHVSIKEAGDV